MTAIRSIVHRDRHRFPGARFLLVLMVVFAWAAFAQSPPGVSPSPDSATLDSPADSQSVDSPVSGTGPWPDRPLVNWSFGEAETLWYDIGWQSIVAGRGEMIVHAPVDTNGRLCYRITSTVKSTPFFSTFYRVDDSAQTFIDVRELYPLRFEKYLREGKYSSDRIADFDPVRGLAYTLTDTVPVPPYVQDALSLLYYTRVLELTPGKDVQVENYTRKGVYTLTIRVLRKERVKVKAGVFNTIVVEPLLQAAGLFKHEGRLTVWLTDDRLHLPVLMKSKVLVGSIVAEMTGYRLGQIRRY